MTGEIKAAIAVAAVAALGCSHWYALEVGRDLGLAAAEKAGSKQKDGVITAITDRVADNAVAQKQNEAKARKVSDGVQKELVEVRDYQPAVVRVQLPALLAAGCGGTAGPAPAPGASGPDGYASGAVVFPEEVQQAFDRFTERAGRLEKEADSVTAIARGHQEFARANGLYGDAESEKK